MTRTRSVLLAVLIIGGSLAAAPPASATHNCFTGSHYAYHFYTLAVRGPSGYHYGTHSYYWGQSCYSAHGNITHSH